MGACSAASFAFIEVGGIRVSCQDHAAGSIGDAIIWIRGAVIKQMVDSSVSGFSGCGLLGANFAEGMEEFVVHCTCIVEEGTNNALDLLDAGFVESWRGIRFGSVLCCSSKRDSCGLVW